MKQIIQPLKALFLAMLLLSACTSNDVYFRYESVPAEGWAKDSALCYAVPITDTTATYNVYVNVRNTSEYPYQNFWFFIEKSFDTQPTVSKDTVECYLAYDNGKWIGNGVGAAFDMPVLIEQNLKFAAAGTYRYKIYQGMREDNLQGIRDIGLRVEKIEE